eukprot:CAMPEP_0201281882 /NCGR_PEP_ID=MMETSP1317-20130820/4296_1 /ASSEMBLY_ACC=CAM_ASM_000770 /TAXON_ID=187299 /ORGANISM="Undescribed Undescribed, Strain Undescribed" /LENGTH=30 /DNA_ID= /DNA_START= /DNA_END= /DNA_ORIENTATION=
MDKELRATVENLKVAEFRVLTMENEVRKNE